MKRLLWLFMVAAMLAAACGPTPPPATQAPGPATPAPTSPPATQPPATSTDAPPELAPAQRAALEALAAALGLPVEQVTLVSAEAVDWPDGCLGITRPGALCTQAVVPGFRIIVEAGGQQYEYHTNQDGTIVAPATPLVAASVAQRAATLALAQQLGLEAAAIRLVSSQAMVWPDACLGLAQAGTACAEVETPGYVVVLEAGGQQYDVHTNQDASATRVAGAEAGQTEVLFAVRAADSTVRLVEAGLPVDPAALALTQGFLPQGGQVGDTVYALTFAQSPAVVAVNVQGSGPVDFITDPSYGLAVWPGSAAAGPRLAWASTLNQGTETTLLVAAPDGSEQSAYLSESLAAANEAPRQLVAEGFTRDGLALYYSFEPFGIGGYIPFGGASSLYRIGLADRQLTEIVPFGFESGAAMLCLDALSPDEQRLVDHCTMGAITVRDLTSGQTTTIQPPAEVEGVRLLGSARFSPDGQRVAFALARGNPDAEQGWVAVSGGLEGGSQVVAAGQPGQYFTVIGWADANTLLLQLNDMACVSGCTSEIWAVAADGAGLRQVADGVFVGFLAE